MVTSVYKSLLLIVLILSPLAVQAVELRAIPEQTRVSLEESFTLELRATGSVDGDPDLSVLQEDFELLGTSQASQTRIINGTISRSTTWILRLLARSAGTKLIPPLCIETDCSDPVAVEILAPGQQQNSGNKVADLLLEVTATPGNLRVQSQLLYTVTLLTRLNIAQASLTDPKPQGVEAVVQKLGEDRQSEAYREGIRYQIIERQYAIFPQETGRLTIPALQLDAQVRANRSSGYDPFNRQVRQLRKRSNEINVDVLPAVEGNGRSWLPATALRLTDDWLQNPPQLTVGEPATRTLVLQASGLPAAQLPQFKLELPPSVKSYPDQPSREDQVGAGGISGTLEQKVALVPTKAGTLQLPAISIDWWDLIAERWRQTLLPAIELEVLPSSKQPAVAPLPPLQTVPPPLEVPTAQAPVDTAAPNVGFWPWLSLGLGCGWLLTLLWVLLRRRAKATPAGEAEKQPGLKEARRELHKQIKARQPNQIRPALLLWGQALWPQQALQNLEQLVAVAGEPLAQQLTLLNRSLYSSAGGNWDHDAMLQAVVQAEKMAQRKEQDGFPPFYPVK